MKLLEIGPKKPKKRPRSSARAKLVEGLTISAAKSHLEANPDGVLHHPMFEDDNFVFMTKSGEWMFCFWRERRVEQWDWTTDIRELSAYDPSRDIQTDWWYEDIAYNDDWELMDQLRDIEPDTSRSIAGPVTEAPLSENLTNVTLNLDGWTVEMIRMAIEAQTKNPKHSDRVRENYAKVLNTINEQAGIK